MYERLMGLQIIDDAKYRAYREAMTPLLQASGGGFGYDFKIAEVLKSQTGAPINRVFTIYFPDESAMKSFFSNPQYLKIKERYFESSVGAVTALAAYTR